MSRRLLAEGLGSVLLACAVVGSGIMAQRLANGNDAVALLANAFATMSVLVVLIGIFGPLSGAHFNPAVSLAACLQRQLPAAWLAGYVAVQLLGCCAGAMLAHAMFAVPLVQVATQVRTGGAQWLSEFIATAGLILVIARSRGPGECTWRVPLWIGAAYWFTASTSFANPAITMARALTDSFAGIRPTDVPAFMLAQLAGVAGGVLLARLLGDVAAVPRAGS